MTYDKRVIVNFGGGDEDCFDNCGRPEVRAAGVIHFDHEVEPGRVLTMLIKDYSFVEYQDMSNLEPADEPAPDPDNAVSPVEAALLDARAAIDEPSRRSTASSPFDFERSIS